MKLVISGDVAAVTGALDRQPELAGAQSEEGVSAALLALYHRQLAVAEALAARRPPDFFEAAALGNRLRLQALIRERPELVREWSPDGFSALHLAAFFGRYECCKSLLNAGAEVNARAHNDMRVTPLHAAAAAAAQDVVELLLAHGADVDAAQGGGWRPLHSAAQQGNVPLAVALLDAGADPEASAEDGRTPLAVAQAAGREEMIALLTGWARPAG